MLPCAPSRGTRGIRAVRRGALPAKVTERLRRHAEQMLTAKLEICQTKADIDKLAREIAALSLKLQFWRGKGQSLGF